MAKTIKELDKDFEKLKTKIKRYFEADFEKIEDAWEFAKTAHSGQKRKTGDPYVIHSLKTAENLADWKLDTASIIAGLLHDVVEDGAATEKDIKVEFGENVSRLVDGVTKVSEIRLRGSEQEEFVENLRKMFLAMSKDIRVVLVKLADRLHNMQTLDALPKEKQKRIAKETLEIFAPLAERLGMGELKAELDDLAFPFVYPKEYKKVKEKAKPHYKKAEKHIKKMKRKLLKEMADEGIRPKIDGRKKHLYSLWRKLERPEIEWDFEKIHDIVALRIMVDTVDQCYIALGVVHSEYKPVPKIGISDFIAQPKPNGYRSIHTKVFGPEGRAAEVQIRTHEMHEQAEYGMAAHWHLSLIKKKGASSEDVEKGKANIVDEKKFEWVKQLAEWQKEVTDSKEFLKAVKFDALESRIFVFSPKGDVFELPRGATPVDFAFAVHTDLGSFIKGAKVNGKIVSLNSTLKSGDMVEILKTKEKKKPNRDWLDFVKTQTAKRKINKSLRKRASKR